MKFMTFSYKIDWYYVRKFDRKIHVYNNVWLPDNLNVSWSLCIPNITSTLYVYQLTIKHLKFDSFYYKCILVLVKMYGIRVFGWILNKFLVKNASYSVFK